MQKHKLENEVNRLKASIHDDDEDGVGSIRKNFSEILENIQAENKKLIDSIRKENEKTTSQLLNEIKNLKK